MTMKMAGGAPEKNTPSDTQPWLPNPTQPSSNPATHKPNKFAVASSLLASMTSLLLGYDVGVMTGAIIYIQKDLKITDVQKEVIMGIFSLYSLIRSAIAGRTSDWIGRRYTIVVGGVIFFVGALLMGFATNYAFLMVGRLVSGTGVGYALMIAPVYTAEVAPAASRGFLISFSEIFINVGILTGYSSSLAFSKLPTDLGWRFMLGIGAIPSLFLIAIVFIMPESPRWLVLQGRLVEAKKVLNRISNSPADSKLRLLDIQEAVGLPKDCNDNSVVPIPRNCSGQAVWRELLLHPTPTVRHMLLCALGMHFFTLACGVESIVLYGPNIFGKVGITNNSQILIIMFAVGVVKLLFTLVSTFFLDRVGRRPLLLTSVAGCLVCLISLGLVLTVIEHRSAEHKHGWPVVLVVASVLFFIGSFSIGMGPISWVYSTEIFPLRLRAQGSSLGIAVNRISSSLSSMTFISLYKAITMGGAFFYYAGITAVAWIFYYTLFPETKGRTLEEMEGLFGRFFKWRSSVEELDARKQEEKIGKTEENSANQTQR